MRSDRSNQSRSGLANRRWIKRLTSAVLLLGGILGLGLIHPASAAEPRRSSDAQILGLWPAPPAEARVLYVQSIASGKDLNIRPSAWRRLANVFTGGEKGNEPLVTPTGISLDDKDNLCLTDTGAAEVWFFDLKRKKSKHWNKVGKTYFDLPVSVAKRKDTLFVSDAGLRRILVFSLRGKLYFEITNSLQRPAGLVISGERLFVADAPAHRIAVFDLEGNLQFHFGKRGSGPGEFNFPTYLATDGRGRVFATDSINARIQIFTVEGRFQTTISKMGDSSGHLSRPKGVALDRQGHLFVVDALFDNFQIFDQQGRFLLGIGAAGSKQGEFWLPAGISISRGGRIYVADSYNHRVQVFQLLDKP